MPTNKTLKNAKQSAKKPKVVCFNSNADNENALKGKQNAHQDNAKGALKTCLKLGNKTNNNNA